MDPALALAGLIVVAVAFELRRLRELAELRRDPGTPSVIRSVPLSFKAPPAPYQSSTGDPVVRRLMLAVALAAALVIPVATTAADPGPCGPDPAFGYRTAAGNAAARAILADLGFGAQLTAQTGIDGAAVITAADARQETILAGTGFFGDSVTHPYAVDYGAFSGIVGLDGQTYYAVRFGQIVGSESGDGSTDTAALYEKYLGSSQPTLSGTPCPVVTIVPPAPVADTVAPGVIARLKGYIANLERCACNPTKLALYWARLELYLAR